jgi:hypothetical protein
LLKKFLSSVVGEERTIINLSLTEEIPSTLRPEQVSFRKKPKKLHRQPGWGSVENPEVLLTKNLVDCPTGD